MRPLSAKILQHDEGMGAPDMEAVDRRAREIALINGRQQFTGTDWAQAKSELRGGHDSSGAHDAVGTFVSELDMEACDVGHHTENMAPDDGENIAEELMAEGMDEALHEQMLAARLVDPAEDGSDEPPPDSGDGEFPG